MAGLREQNPRYRYKVEIFALRYETEWIAADDADDNDDDNHDGDG